MRERESEGAWRGEKGGGAEQAAIYFNGELKKKQSISRLDS